MMGFPQPLLVQGSASVSVVLAGKPIKVKRTIMLTTVQVSDTFTASFSHHLEYQSFSPEKTEEYEWKGEIFTNTPSLTSFKGID